MNAQTSISSYDQKITFEMTLYDAGLIYTALRKLARNALMYEHDLHEFVKEIMDTIIEWDDQCSHNDHHCFYKSGTFRSTPELELFHITLNGKIYFADDIEKKINAIMSFRSWQIIHAALRTTSKEEINYPKYYEFPTIYKMLRKRVTSQMRLEYHDQIKSSIERILRMLNSVNGKVKVK